jgi:hypothetical protein
MLDLKEEILMALTISSSFSLPSLSISVSNFKSSALSFILSLALDSSTLNTLEESISSPPIISPFTIIIIPLVSSPLKVKKRKTKGEKIIKKKKKRKPSF